MVNKSWARVITLNRRKHVKITDQGETYHVEVSEKGRKKLSDFGNTVDEMTRAVVENNNTGMICMSVSPSNDTDAPMPAIKTSVLNAHSGHMFVVLQVVAAMIVNSRDDKDACDCPSCMVKLNAAKAVLDVTKTAIGIIQRNVRANPSNTESAGENLPSFEDVLEAMKSIKH